MLNLVHDGMGSIVDFTDDHDLIQMNGLNFSEVTIQQSGQDTRVEYSDVDALVLKYSDAVNLSEEDLSFV